MVMRRHFTPEERVQAVHMFVKLLSTGVAQLEAARQVGREYGVSRQRLCEWSREDGYVLRPSFAEYRALEVKVAQQTAEIQQLRAELARVKNHQEQVQP